LIPPKRNASRWAPSKAASHSQPFDQLYLPVWIWRVQGVLLCMHQNLTSHRVSPVKAARYLWGGEGMRWTLQCCSDYALVLC
jgi:hypothetical protein